MLLKCVLDGADIAAHLETVNKLSQLPKFNVTFDGYIYTVSRWECKAIMVA